MFLSVSDKKKFHALLAQLLITEVIIAEHYQIKIKTIGNLIPFQINKITLHIAHKEFRFPHTERRRRMQCISDLVVNMKMQAERERERKDSRDYERF